MIVQIPESLPLLGRLETAIVGIQHYEGAKSLNSPEVILKRTPENPHDANAIAVFTPQDCPIGHLPRHDAAYFAPLVDAGILALKGKAGKPEDKYQLPLLLEIYATPKAAEILAPDESDDWRAIFHNLFIGLWGHLDRYSCAALQEFRNRFRSLAREQELYPKTQLFYRMLKTHIAELDKHEESSLREFISSAVTGMDFGPWTGWDDFAVIPLDAPGTPETPPPMAADSSVLPDKFRTPDMLRHLPARCPYPHGARGSALMVDGDLDSLDWFASPECAQVYWFQPLVDAFQRIVAETDISGCSPSPKPSGEAKVEILVLLREASYLAKPGGADGKTAIQIFGVKHNGTAIVNGGILECLRLRPAGCPLPGTNPDLPSRATSRP